MTRLLAMLVHLVPTGRVRVISLRLDYGQFLGGEVVEVVVILRIAGIVVGEVGYRLGVVAEDGVVGRYLWLVGHGALVRRYVHRLAFLGHGLPPSRVGVAAATFSSS